LIVDYQFYLSLWGYNRYNTHIMKYIMKYFLFMLFSLFSISSFSGESKENELLRRLVATEGEDKLKILHQLQ
jgi:hypothetical protein